MHFSVQKWTKYCANTTGPKSVKYFLYTEYLTEIGGGTGTGRYITIRQRHKTVRVRVKRSVTKLYMSLNGTLFTLYYECANLT